jgi:RNA polymerase sigma factor (sigma-70 family)
LLQRIQSVNFAGWQRRADEHEDLANQACTEFYSQCINNRNIPDKALNYVVTIAKNIAHKQYHHHLEKAAIFEPLTDDHDVLSDEDNSDGEIDPIFEEARAERLVMALNKLPLRQKQAFEIRFKNLDLTYAELGKRMNISEDGFRKNFDRACDALEILLDPDKQTERVKSVRS